MRQRDIMRKTARERAREPARGRKRERRRREKERVPWTLPPSANAQACEFFPRTSPARAPLSRGLLLLPLVPIGTPV